MLLIAKRIALLVLLVSFTGGCAVHYDGVRMDHGRPRIDHMTPELQHNIDELTVALEGLGPTIDPVEAREVAHDAYIYPMWLANDWDLAWPPLWQNTLRNAKKRKAGLCVDWAQAMRAYMRTKHLKTFDLYWGVANRGNPWQEHSTLVVTEKGKPFTTGIILDPWRNSGDLFWTRINNDPTYPWKYWAGPG